MITDMNRLTKVAGGSLAIFTAYTLYAVVNRLPSLMVYLPVVQVLLHAGVGIRAFRRGDREGGLIWLAGGLAVAFSAYYSYQGMIAPAL